MKIFRRRQLRSGLGVSIGAGTAESWFIVRSAPEKVLLSQTIIPLLLGLGCLAGAPARGFAEESQPEFQQYPSDLSDATLTPQQWRQRGCTTSTRGICGSGAIPRDPFDPVQPRKRRTNGSTCHQTTPVLNQETLFQPAMGFLFSSAATVLGADRMTFSGFRKPGGTISIDVPPKICRIGGIAGEDPWRCSSARAQAAILKWNCGIC
jgi:hypothetical protein